MYQTNSFDKLTAAPYVSQYVGNSLAEQARSLERLQGRYDAGVAMENQMTRIAKAIPLAPEDEYMRPQMESYYNDLFRGYAENGDYHRILPRIQSEAATVESMYKAASSQYEKYLKQQEAISKTKASDVVKADYLKNMYSGDSKFDPGVGFRFGSIRSALPSDAQDVDKYALDMADKVEKFTQSISRYQSREVTQKKLQELGIVADEAIMEELNSTTMRDPKKVRAVVYNALMKNPDMQQFIQQEARARTNALPEEELDAQLLSRNLPTQMLDQLDINSKRSMLSSSLSSEEVTRAIGLAEAVKSGTLSYTSNQQLTNVKWDAGNGNGGGATTPGVVISGDGFGLAQNTFNMNDFTTAYGKDKAAYATADEQGKQILGGKLLRNKNFFQNYLRTYIESDDHDALVAELYSDPNGKTANQIKDLYDLAEKAGYTTFSDLPTKARGKGFYSKQEQVPNWDAALDRILYQLTPEMLDKNTGSKDAKLFAEKLDDLFGGSGKIMQRIEQTNNNGKNQISLNPRTLEGEYFDGMSKYLTTWVKANQGNFGVVSGLDATGELKSDGDLNTFLKRKAVDLKTTHDVNDYKILELESAPGKGNGTLAIVFEGKNGNPRQVFMIDSEGSVPVESRVNYYKDSMSKLEKKSKQLDIYNEPIFSTFGEQQLYTNLKSKVVQTLYNEPREYLIGMRSAGKVAGQISLPAGPDYSGRVLGNVRLEPDPRDPESGKYIYELSLPMKGREADIIRATTPENLLYQFFNYNKNIQNAQ
jgi:hypothetical protein